MMIIESLRDALELLKDVEAYCLTHRADNYHDLDDILDILYGAE